MDKTKTPVYLCKSWYDGESDTVRDCTCGTCNKAIKKVKPSQKQQFIEKSLKKILTSKFIIALALELPAEVYDDFIKEIAKVIHFQLSECWDMAGEDLINKIEKVGLIGRGWGVGLTKDEWLEIKNSLTSQKEGKA